MGSAPEVTVVIPTKDRAELLEAALAGVLRQEGVELEMIVVDDGSGDATGSLLERVGDSRLRTLRHATARGVSAARNTGIAEARGGWIAFLDDDDVWSPKKLRAQVDTALREDADFVYGGAVLIDEHRTPIEELRSPDPSDLEVLLLERYVVPAGSSNVTARTDLVRRLGGFDERLSVLADWDFWIRLAGAGRAAACPDILVGYSQHPGNMLLDEARNLTREFEYLARKHRALGMAKGVEFDRLAFSRVVAWCHRRAGRRFRAVGAYLRGAVRYRSPGNVLRAAATLVGEGAMTRRRRPVAVARPAWLDLYR
jgi:glycosyltransferase involved in cell wall biosynthesis